MFKRLFSLLVLALFAVSVSAQEMMDIIPNDPEVRTGTLEGGSHYYIRANKKDPQRANFHIVYQVGAAQEADNQNGLAHFLEHMAFNGSKNYHGDKLIDYLQTIGVRFGENLNAGTAQQLTTYMITDVPITRPGIIDSALLILHDWAGFISLNDKDIDEERGVIREEWRQGNGAQWRVMEKHLPAQFQTSMLAKRNVIGNEEVLKSFTYQDIKDFYHKWYRPDLQAFIIVGDFDAAEMEAKLKAVMADVKAFDVKTPKEKIVIPDNETPMVSIVTDPELSSNVLKLYIRQKGIPFKYNNTYLVAKSDMINSLYNLMINERFSDISQKPDAPFLNAGTSLGSLGDMFTYPVDGYQALTATVVAKDGKIAPAFNAMLTELYRAQRGGFTASELERAKAKITARIQNEYNNRNDRSNSQYEQALEWSFLFNTPFPSAEVEFELNKKLIENTSLDEVNQTVEAWMPEKNWVVTVSMPEKENNPAPTQEQLLEVIKTVKGSEIEILKEEVVTKPLFTGNLKGSKITKTEQGDFGTTIWTLKNGIRVIFKPSQIKADELLLRSSQFGGTSKIKELPLFYASSLYSAAMQRSGVGEFQATELSKMMAGKMASCAQTIGQASQGYNGSCAPKDAETMFQLLYLNATEPRFDTTAINVLRNQLSSVWQNQLKTPDLVAFDSLSKTLYGGNPRAIGIPSILPLPSMLSLEALTPENLKELNKMFFSSANNMTFTLIGNMDPEVLKPLVEKYIGSLPVSKEKPVMGNIDILPRKGVIKNEFRTPMESAKVTASIVYTGNWEYSPVNDIIAGVLNSILEIRYTKSVREEAGGTYGVGTMLNANSLDKRYLQLIIFNTDESKVNDLLPIIYKEIDDLIANGPKQEDLDKVKENYKKAYAEGLNSNRTWLNYIVDTYVWNENNYDNYVKNVDSLTPEVIKEAAKKMYGQGNICTVVQLPAAK